jgi:membrane-bound lytic murein transglycosylase F
MSPSWLDRETLAASVAIDWVEDLVVASPLAPLGSIDDLARSDLHIHRSMADGIRRSGIALGAPRFVLRPVPEEISLETVVQRVVSGRYETTVVDSGLVEAIPGGQRLRVLGPLAERRPLVWVVRAQAQRLRSAVNDYLFAEKVLARGRRRPVCRDLAEIRAASTLRVVTRNSPVTCTIERGGLEGFEYDLALAFARELKVRLELAMPPPGVDPLDWLGQGFGDLAALHEPVDPETEGRFLVSFPYRLVDLVSIGSVRNPAPAGVEDLAGATVAASRPVAALCAELPLVPPMSPAAMITGADALSALLEVSRGVAGTAVVDEDTAKLELAARPDLQEGVIVLPGVELAWLVNPSSPELMRRIDRFLEWAARSGLVRQLALSELGTWKPYVPPYLPEVPDGALTPYDELLRWAGRRHQIDWRLLASLMYEESRFDPGAIGPGGSAGLFQFMPPTWRELGVEDPHHPAEAVEAGARYLSRLMEMFDDVPMADRVAMAIASYNVGPRHVFDARRHARAMGLDPQVWAGNVETAMLILDNPDVARQYPAGTCRCRRAVGYTRRILRRYYAYAEQFPPS